MASKKKCILCGKEFELRHNAQRICNSKHFKTCAICGKEFEITLYSKNKQTCSRKCTEKLREQTTNERYGKPFAQQVESIRNKSIKTNLEKFGVERPAMSQQIKDKMKATCNERYGVDTPFQMVDFQEKVHKTCQEKYGVDFTSQIPGRTDKMQKTNLEKYGAVAPLCNGEIQNEFSNKMIKKYGVPYYCMTVECRSLQKHTISALNKKFSDLLSSIDIENTLEFPVDKYSYDVYIPSQKLLIEIDPTATHNTICTPWSEKTSITKEYHKLKSACAISHGYKCMHIFDWDDWIKILNLIRPKKRIYGRNCTIRKLDINVCNKFEQSYHLQSSCRGQQIRYGLYYNNELIQVMTIGKPRYNSNYEWELLRLCTKSEYRVIGGASKLFSSFLKEFNPISVISYCDASKFDGDVYTKLNMKLVHKTSPNRIWSKGRKSVTSNLLRQRGFDQLFNTNYGRGTSNDQLMMDHGWLPVYDCGQYVYEWRQ